MTETLDSFWGCVAALDAARSGLRDGTGGAVDSIRRLAAHLGQVASAAGLARVVKASKVLEAAQPHEIGKVVESVLHFIRTEVASDLHDRPTVLVVEDDRLTGSIVRGLLEGSNLRVLTAESGAAAQRLIASANISLVLLDLLLPDADGRELLLQLRSDPRTAWLPVIVLTAKDDVVTQSECYAFGADGFLNKPVDGPVLTAVVSAKLRRSQQLQAQAHRDPLTLLPNRAEFWDAFERALIQRNGAPLSVALIDLDHFRVINETYGHATGDEVLRVVARVLANSLRARDFLARWGGEEFCLFLPGTDLNAATRILDHALRRVSRTPMTAHDGRRFSVTFSAGVAAVGGGVGGGDALAQADRFLYSAKSGGRNRVLSASDTPPVGGRVLIADDDAGTRLLVQKILQREGFHVHACADGGSALNAATAQDFSLIVVDVSMPGMNGFELVRALRMLPRFHSIPIVMLTGLDAESDIVRGFELGVSDYVVKPFNRADFVARVWRLLKRESCPSQGS